jgi:hypothetical protein
MTGKPRLKEEYLLADCCRPTPEDAIVGYYSHTNILKVHRADCPNLEKTEQDRLVTLLWEDVLAPESYVPGDDFKQLDQTDFSILKHHREHGIDYSLLVAKALSIPKEEAFSRHARLRQLELLERVDAVMVRYRKGVVDNKWIKHRNHTYYDLTDKGRKYLEYYLS